MSPSRKIIAPNNLYTALLALAVGVAVATTIFVAVKCYTDYGTIFKIIEISR